MIWFIINPATLDELHLNRMRSTVIDLFKTGNAGFVHFISFSFTFNPATLDTKSTHRYNSKYSIFISYNDSFTMFQILNIIMKWQRWMNCTLYTCIFLTFLNE